MDSLGEGNLRSFAMDTPICDIYQFEGEDYRNKQKIEDTFIQPPKRARRVNYAVKVYDDENDSDYDGNKDIEHHHSDEEEYVSDDDWFTSKSKKKNMKFKNMNNMKLEEDSNISESEERPTLECEERPSLESEEGKTSESEARPISVILDEVINEYTQKIKSIADDTEVKKEYDTSLKSKNEKSVKNKNESSTTKVKKPKGRRNAYTFFIQQCREETIWSPKIMPYLSYTEQVKNWALKWKMMSWEEKKDFMELERLDSLRYDREFAAMKEKQLDEELAAMNDKQLDEQTHLNTPKENKPEILKDESVKVNSHQGTTASSQKMAATHQSTKTVAHQSTKPAAHQSTKTTTHSTKSATHQSTKSATHQSEKSASRQNSLDEQLEEMKELDSIYMMAKNLYVRKAVINAQLQMGRYHNKSYHDLKQHYEKKWETYDEEKKFKWIKKAKKEMAKMKTRKIETVSTSGCDETGKGSDSTNASVKSLSEYPNRRSETISNTYQVDHIIEHRTCESSATFCVHEKQIQSASTSGKWTVSNSGDCPGNKINEKTNVESSIKNTPTKTVENFMVVEAPNIKVQPTKTSKILMESPRKDFPTNMLETIVDVETPRKLTPTKHSEVMEDEDLKQKCSTTSDGNKISVTFSTMSSIEQNTAGDKPHIVNVETFSVGPKGDNFDSTTTGLSSPSLKRKLESPYRDSGKRAKIDKVPFKQKNTKEKKTQLTLSNTLQLLGSPKRKSTQFTSPKAAVNQNVYIKQEPDVIDFIDKEYNQENNRNTKDMAFYKSWSMKHKQCGEYGMLHDDPAIKKSPLKDVSYVYNEDPAFLGRY